MLVTRFNAVFSLKVTVFGYYAYWYGDIQSDSHYIDCCLGREKLDKSALCTINNFNNFKPKTREISLYRIV